MMPRPALTILSNQAPKSLKQAERRQVVESNHDQQCQEQRQAAPKCPFLGALADRAPPDRLRRVEKQMSTIEHRDWQEVDEPQIYGEEREQLDEFERPEAGLLTRDLRHFERAAQI